MTPADPPPALDAATYSRLRRREVRARIRPTVLWTLLALVAFVAASGFVVADRGVGWIVGTCLVVAVVVIACAAAIAWGRAGRRATSLMVREWARARGFAYWGRDVPTEPTPNPQEARFDDHMLATESVPEATPLLRRGNRRYATDVLAGTIDGIAVRLVNWCFEEDTYDSKGARHTTYTWNLVALLPVRPRITPMRLVRRSSLGRVLKGADDAIAGVGDMQSVKMENRDFNDRFSLRVADDVDQVVLYAVFDQALQERLADGRDVPDISLVEAEGDWLLLADDGVVQGNRLERLDAMVTSVRWALATLR